MSNQTTNQPVSVLRDGRIKATIWKNESEKGPFYSVNFTRTRVVEGTPGEDPKYYEETSFSGTDILKIEVLSRLAYLRIRDLRLADKHEHKLQNVA